MVSPSCASLIAACMSLAAHCEVGHVTAIVQGCELQAAPPGKRLTSPARGSARKINKRIFMTLPPFNSTAEFGFPSKCGRRLPIITSCSTPALHHAPHHNQPHRLKNIPPHPPPLLRQQTHA